MIMCIMRLIIEWLLYTSDLENALVALCLGNIASLLAEILVYIINALADSIAPVRREECRLVYFKPPYDLSVTHALFFHGDKDCVLVIVICSAPYRGGISAPSRG